MDENKEKIIITVKDLLNIDNINIPEYQRPYKWTIKNVNQLIDDIVSFSNKSAYRLGTIVFHKEIKEEKETLNIVDGQQRFITITLLFKAILVLLGQLLVCFYLDIKLRNSLLYLFIYLLYFCGVVAFMLTTTMLIKLIF